MLSKTRAGFIDFKTSFDSVMNYQNTCGDTYAVINTDVAAKEASAIESNINIAYTCAWIIMLSPLLELFLYHNWHYIEACFDKRPETRE